MTCTHYQPFALSGGYCAINAYGKNVMVGVKVCARCPQYDGPVRGLGDAIHKVAMPVAKLLNADCLDESKQHLKADSDCMKRRVALNV